MTDFVWPNSVRISSCDWRPISNSRATPDTFTGGQQTATRPGDKMGCRVRVNNSSGAERAKLRALVHALRGRGNRCFIPDYSFRQRGSFPGVELFNAPDLSNASAWTTNNLSIVTSDGTLRIVVAGTGTREAYQNVTVSQYSPYVLRVIDRAGRGTSAISIGPYFDDGVASTFDVSTSRGYHVASRVSLNSGPRKAAIEFFNATSGYGFDDYLDLLFASMAQCALADGAGNGLLQSDAIDNVAWTKTGIASTGANSDTDPFGSSTGDSIVENSSAGTHSFTQSMTRSSAAGDWESYGYFGRKTGTRDLEFYIDDGAGNGAKCNVNLSTGVVTATGLIGTGVNVRAYSTNAGNSWWRIHVIARLPATTTARLQVFMTSGGNISYTGDGSSSIKVFRCGILQSSSPSLPTATTTTAVSTASQSGASIYVKGLPVSTNGLLVAGDLVEINKIMYPVAADLNSDSAGIGQLHLAFPPPRGIADATPVIVNRPLARMMLVNDPEIACVPGGVSDFEFDFVQDLSA